MEEKFINGLGLSDLWKVLSIMNIAQLLATVFLIAIILITLLIIIFKKPLTKLMNSRDEKDFSSYGWPTEEIINIHRLPSKLSLEKEEAEEYKKKLLHKIDMLRKEQCTGKQFILNMEETIYMSEAVRDMFYELAENSIKLNIVRLVYVMPRTSKIALMKQFYFNLQYRCKKSNRPGSWVVKTSTTKKKFYEE